MSLPHYKQVIKALDEPAFIITADVQILECNQAAAALFTFAEVSSVDSLLHACPITHRDLFRDYLQRCARTRSPLVGSLELTTSKGVRQFTSRGAVLDPRRGSKAATILLRLLPKEETNFRFEALKGQIKDLNAEVAKRRRAEYQLQTKSRWLEVTLESIGDAVITTDADNRVTFMNRVAEAMTGWVQSEAMSLPLAEVFVVVNEFTGEPVENPAEKALRLGQVVDLANHTVLLARNGARIAIEDTAAPIVLDGNIEGAILVFHDVSSRRILEKKLIERAEHLELANRRKNEFMTMLAHELRSPLAPISNAAQLLCMENESPLRPDSPQAIIARQASHLKRLVDDMLDVSRIVRGKMNVVLEPIELASLVAAACEDFRSQFAENRICLNTKIPASEVWVQGDAQRLTQVLHNLLANAVKFTPPGGSATVSLIVEGQSVTLRIADSGVGMEASELQDLFEPFTQGAQALDREKGGLGLGLSLVKGIITRHSGQVAAGSAGKHKGTVIQVVLPLARKLAAEAPDGARPTVRERERILLIEDDNDAAQTMKALLELLDNEVHLASTGPEGLNKAVALMPTLIICDIGLPGLDGFAVAKRLRQSQLTSHISLVALTGYGNDEFVNRASEAGFDHHVTKPASLDDLQAILARNVAKL